MNAEHKSLGIGLAIADFDLIYGIGNDGRQDDGLGWAAVDALENSYPQQQYLRHYQLFFEDVALLHGMNRVLCIDAYKKTTKQDQQDLGFAIERVPAAMELSFTSHSMSLPSIAAMCQLCYQSCPDIWLLSVQGYCWELQMGLSKPAQQNLSCALRSITQQGVRPVGCPVL